MNLLLRLLENFTNLFVMNSIEINREITISAEFPLSVSHNISMDKKRTFLCKIIYINISKYGFKR